MEFKERLKELRENAGLSMASLAKMAGVTKAAIGNYESGIRVPRKEQLEAFADIFNVDLDYLTCRTNQRLKTSFSENRILYLLKLLNERGKAEAVKRVQELTYIPEYVLEDVAMAAHATDSNVSEDMEMFLDEIKRGEGNGNTSNMD